MDDSLPVWAKTTRPQTFPSATVYSITSSARASSVSGKVTPSSLAALRLMTGLTVVILIPVL